MKKLLLFFIPYLFLFPSFAFANETISQSGTVVDNSSICGFNGFHDGTFFTPAFNETSVSGTDSLKTVGSPAQNITVSIRNDNSGIPSASILGSVSIAFGSVTSSFSDVSFGSISVSLTAGTKYWLVLDCADDTSTTNLFQQGLTTSNSPLPEWVNDGTSWTVNGGNKGHRATLNFVGASTTIIPPLINWIEQWWHVI